MQLHNAWLEEAAHEVRACSIEVGEVGRVGLMEVVIAFRERGVRAGYDGEKEGRGSYVCMENARRNYAMPENCAPDPNLLRILVPLCLIFGLDSSTYMPHEGRILQICKKHTNDRNP